MARSNEPLVWSLFSAGGVVSAFLMPITMLLIGIGIPAGVVTTAALFDAVHHPLGRLYLFALIALSLFHWAHRFRHTLMDLGLSSIGVPLAILCYGGALLGTIASIVLLLSH